MTRKFPAGKLGPGKLGLGKQEKTGKKKGGNQDLEPKEIKVFWQFIQMNNYFCLLLPYNQVVLELSHVKM